MRVRTLTEGACVCLLCAANATAQNLITNGDFDRGDLSGWSIAGGGVPQTTIAFDGSVGNPAGSALLDRVTSLSVDNKDILYQVIPVTPGQQYKISADWKGDLYNGGTGRNWAEVMVRFVSSGAPIPDGTQFLDSWIQYKKASDGGPHQPPATGWDWESVLLSPEGGPADGIYTATDAYMVLGFNLGGRDVTSNNTQPGYYHMDNVSATPYPPTTQPMFTNITPSGAHVVLEGTNGPPRGAYQVRRSPDVTLPRSLWMDRGLDTFAPNGDFTFADIPSVDAANFYQLEVVSLVGAPEITVEPKGSAALVGQTVNFSVTAEGAPPLHYQWYYNTNTVLAGETNADLALIDVQLADAGMYSVSVSNLFGLTDSVFAELSVSSNPGVAVPDGYATRNGGTTGGGDAAPITVSTASAFRSAVDNNTPAVIVVDGRLDVGSVDIGSNKSIMGADTNSGLYGGTIGVEGSNYIFQDLTFGPSGNGGDVMEISGASNVFITRCTFHDSDDELCSVVRQADFVTISWSKFYFDSPDSHSYAHLIGNGDDVTEDRGKLHVTLHHNWYAEGIRGRMPRVRFGHVHIYNNFYNSTGNGYCIGVGFECHIRVENSHFQAVNRPWADYGGSSNGEIGWSDLKFSSATQPTFMPNTFPVFTPPYAFTPDPVDDVKTLVVHGAGNVP